MSKKIVITINGINEKNSNISMENKAYSLKYLMERYYPSWDNDVDTVEYECEPELKSIMVKI